MVYFHENHHDGDGDGDGKSLNVSTQNHAYRLLSI